MIIHAVCKEVPPSLSEYFSANHTYALEEDNETITFYLYKGFAVEKKFFIEGKKIQVKCINEVGLSSLNFQGQYTAYQFEGYDEHLYVELSENDFMWISKIRFEIILERSTVPEIKIDDEEEKLWNLLKPTILPNHCICGILKEKCRYHAEIF